MPSKRTREELCAQAARWEEIRERATKLSQRNERLQGIAKPFLCISRQLGSGGNALGQGVGERLGWKVYDREIIQRIAERTHVPESVLVAHDERPSLGLLDDYLSHLFVPGDPGQATYLRELGITLLSIVREESSVLLGRGANWILAGERGLRLRVMAPRATRVARIAAERHISVGDAERLVANNDRAQRDFIRQAYGRDIDDPLGYDLLVNTEQLNQEDLCALVATGLARRLGVDTEGQLLATRREAGRWPQPRP